MAYIDRVPTYVYDLPCGHPSRTETRSEAAEDGLHWFCCRRHDDPVWHGIEPRLLIEERPMYRSGSKFMGDHQLSVKIDSAIWKDRVAAYYRTVWNAQTVREVAATLGVQREHVEAVSLDLGVYEHIQIDDGL